VGHLENTVTGERQGHRQSLDHARAAGIGFAASRESWLDGAHAGGTSARTELEQLVLRLILEGTPAAIEALESLELAYPKLTKPQRAELARARRALAGEE